MVYKNSNKERKSREMWRENHKEELAEYAKKYRVTHKEQLDKTAKEYRDTHKEEAKEWAKKYQETHKEEIKKYRKKYQETHRVERKEYDKIYNQTHKDQQKEYRKKYYELNKESMLRNNRIWILKNPIKNRERERRKQRKLRSKLMDILGGAYCVRCGFNDVRALEFDHINGGGRKDYKDKGSSKTALRYYIKHPEEAKQKLQVLCSNHNRIKVTENEEFAGKKLYDSGKISSWVSE